MSPINKTRIRYTGYAVLILLILWWLITLIAHMNAWKAVFLDNDQVYFGKFINIPFTPNIALKKVYYLKSTATSTDFIVTSIKDDVHQPKDSMKISKSHILYSEELRTDSSLAKAIETKESGK